MSTDRATVGATRDFLAEHYDVPNEDSAHFVIVAEAAGGTMVGTCCDDLAMTDAMLRLALHAIGAPQPPLAAGSPSVIVGRDDLELLRKVCTLYAPYPWTDDIREVMGRTVTALQAEPPDEDKTQREGVRAMTEGLAYEPGLDTADGLCPGGCGCRLGTDDADRFECGCDEGCCE